MSLPSAAGSAFLRTFTLLTVAGSVALFAGCGGDDASDSGDSGGSSDSGITATSGDQIFKDANCSSCHTLAAASAKGAIGPNLDEVKPNADTVKEYVTNGEGSMPSFSGRLSAAQIQAVSDYVAEVAGQ